MRSIQSHFMIDANLHSADSKTVWNCRAKCKYNKNFFNVCLTAHEVWLNARTVHKCLNNAKWLSLANNGYLMST